MFNIDDVVRYTGERYEGRVFRVSGVNGRGWNADKQEHEAQVTLEFDGFDGKCNMRRPAELFELAG